jgi:hypothetical protein
MQFRIGSLVRERGSDVLMRVVGFVDEFRVAICQVWGSTALRRVAVVLLVLGGFLGGTCEGHTVEELPTHHMVQPVTTPPPIVASGAIAEAPPPRQMLIVPQPEYPPQLLSGFTHMLHFPSTLGI